MSAPARFAWVVVFAIALGWFEGAVVVYLRALAYPGGFAFPVAPLAADILTTEVVREAASLVLMGAVAVLAGTTVVARAAAFFVIFGLWDLVYYATLWLVLGWPESLATPDVLFLIPTVWVGPVWAPSLVASIFVAGGSTVFLTPSIPRSIRAIDWAAAVVAGLAVAISFMDAGATMETASPDAFTPWLYWSGLVLGLGAFVSVERRERARARARPHAA